MAPFLPNSSLLFITKTLTSLRAGSLGIRVVIILVLVTTVINSTIGCAVKQLFNRGLFDGPGSGVFHHDCLSGARRFCRGRNNGAVVLTHFIPVIEAFTPFITKVNRVSCHRFTTCGIVNTLL